MVEARQPRARLARPAPTRRPAPRQFELICARRARRRRHTRNRMVAEHPLRAGLREALDAAINAAYPDVRLGRVPGGQSRPRPGVLREPAPDALSQAAQLRLPADRRGEARPRRRSSRSPSPRSRWTHRQSCAFSSPRPRLFEALARRLYRRHENRLVRAERWGLPEGGLTSTLNRAEMRAAEQTQNRSLFWLETVVAADSPEACKAIAAAVQARRGENRLHRRYMLVRQRLYRRRFPRAFGPLIPSPRALVSAAEVAHLLELPSARMKGVPVRRATVPRIPAPPEARGERAGPPRRARPPAIEAAASSHRSCACPPSADRRHRPPPEGLLPMLRAENAEVLIHPATARSGRCWSARRAAATPPRCCRSTSTTSRTRTRRRSSSTPSPSSRASACG